MELQPKIAQGRTIMPIKATKFEQTHVLNLLETHHCNLGQLSKYLNCSSAIVYIWISLQPQSFKDKLSQYKYKNGNYRAKKVKNKTSSNLVKPPEHVEPSNVLSLPVGLKSQYKAEI